MPRINRTKRRCGTCFATTSYYERLCSKASPRGKRVSDYSKTCKNYKPNLRKIKRPKGVPSPTLHLPNRKCSTCSIGNTDDVWSYSINCINTFIRRQERPTAMRGTSMDTMACSRYVRRV